MAGKGFRAAALAVMLAAVFGVERAHTQAHGLGAQTVSLGEAIGNMVEDLSAGMEPNARIAIISMAAGSVTMANHLSDEMTIAFVNTQRFLVLNRSQLELIAAEQQLNLAGLIDDATAQAIGRFAGVQFMMTGSFEPFGNVYRLRVQVTEVETAIIRRIATVDVRNDNIVSALLGTAGRRPVRRGRDPDLPRANWISGYTGLLNMHHYFGIRYERDINRFFSVGGTVTALGFDIGALATARFFPGGSPFYLELGMGWGWIGGHEDRELWLASGFMVNPSIGVRLGGRRIGFFANPFIALPVVFGESKWAWDFSPHRPRPNQPSGGNINIGFLFAFAIGWAW